MRIFACLAGVMLAAAPDLAACAAAAHFDEYQYRAIAGDEVDFRRNGSGCCSLQWKALRLEVSGSAAFARLAAQEMRREFFEEHEDF